MAHPVAVGAQECQIVQPGLAGAGYVEGQDMVNLDVAPAEGAVEAAEVEGANFALQRLAALLSLSNLEVPEAAVAFPVQRPAGEEPAFDGIVPPVVDLVGIFGKRVQFPAADRFAQRRSSFRHLCGAVSERGDSLLVQTPPFGGDARVLGVQCRQVRGFEADAACGPELGVGLGRAFVNRQRPEQVREIRYAGISEVEAFPSVLNDESAGQQQLVTGPCRARRHGQYRMSVRCHVRVGRAAVVGDAHLEAVALSVGSVTLCSGWWQSASVGNVRKEGA